jgi:UDP-2,3-diacylglucosamine pyrophosphatase LpxH
MTITTSWRRISAPPRMTPSNNPPPAPPAPAAPSTPADALIISDLHLGAENCQAKAAADFLQRLLDGEIRAAQLIINGDVFDSIDFRRLKKTHWKVLSQIRHLSDKLDIIWIAGNHDGSAEIVSHLLGVRVVEQHLLLSGGRRILIIHGHAFDEFIEDHPLLTRLADFAYYCLQKLDRTHYIARLAKSKSKTFIRCTDKIRSGARQLAAKLDCETVICGHTHRAEATAPSPAEPIGYYNSGCWTEQNATYLLIHASEVSLHTYAPHLAPVLAG